MIKSLITEYGLPWVVNRSLYSAKLKIMRAIPISERMFEKNVNVERINLFNLDVENIEKFLQGLSDKKKIEIIIIANNALEGNILGFSSIKLNYGNPINWHYNPITKVEVSNSLKWYQIPDFDTKRGDIKVIWEASRFTHFFYFARAYLITKDKKYYDAFSNQLNHWLKENPYSYGVNYKCGQEATLRMINALLVYSVFKYYKLVTEKDIENLFELVKGSYKKILSNFFYAHKCIKNNHTLSEITGLIIGAWCCNDENSLQKAYSLLDKEIQKQFSIDGGYIQNSFNYQRFALQLIECIYKISENTKINISEKSKELINNSVMLLYQMQNGCGEVPNYGPNDGALIFPVTACEYRDFRSVLNTVYILINNKRLYELGDYDEELLWFGNKYLLNSLCANIKKESSVFMNSGFYTLRHENGFIMTCLQEYKSRPAHMDQLHIDLWHKGINIFCDSGTYSYASEIGNQLSSTAGHNTVKLDGIEQMNKKGTFLVTDWTKRKNIKFFNDSFSGTMVSQNGYEHTRTIKKTDYGYMVSDEVTGNREYCEFYFHTPCRVRIIPEGFELFYSGELRCTVLTTGTINIKKTYRILYYLKKEEINCIYVQGNMKNSKCSMTFEIHLIN